jgi:hypothetical protein
MRDVAGHVSPDLKILVSICGASLQDEFSLAVRQLAG